MLALKQALSLPSLKQIGYIPPSIDNLIAWYKNRAGVTFLDPTAVVLTVSRWADSSNNSHDMVQATASEQPTFVSGALTFVSANQQNLQTTSQISLTGDFTVGIRIYPAIVGAGTFLADNTTGGELFKYTSSTRISLKIDASSATALDLDEGTFGDDYLIITRASNVLTLWKNGVAQTGTTPTLAGTADIDAIGIRRTDTDPFDGTIEEILIYDISNADLTAKLNTRLASL